MRIADALRLRAGRRRHSAPRSDRLDTWLEAAHGERLAALDRACTAGGPDRFAHFRGLDADLWALLLTQEYDAYPNIRALLPDVPDRALQELWNGTSGVPLAVQSVAFYRRLRERFAEHADTGLQDARVLDFGCGWGRLTRFLARDVEPGALFGCDPVQSILDTCATLRVPATLARSDPRSDAAPFADRVDLAFAFSVFTHLSEPATGRALAALAASLRPGGILVATIRPPAYLHLAPELAPALQSLGPDPRAALRAPRHLFVPHGALEHHPQYQGGAMDYGEAVITLAQVRERWTERFELLGADLLAADMHQLMVTMRRR